MRRPVGATAENARKTFGFEQVTTGADAVFDNRKSTPVIIATPHESHANLNGCACIVGKSVFVEKAVASNRAGLALV